MYTSVKFFVPRLTVGPADCAPGVETPKSRATPSATAKAALTARRVCFLRTRLLPVRRRSRASYCAGTPCHHVRLHHVLAAPETVRRDRELERPEQEIGGQREGGDHDGRTHDALEPVARLVGDD